MATIAQLCPSGDANLCWAVWRSGSAGWGEEEPGYAEAIAAAKALLAQSRATFPTAA